MSAYEFWSNAENYNGKSLKVSSWERKFYNDSKKLLWENWVNYQQLLIENYRNQYDIKQQFYAMLYTDVTTTPQENIYNTKQRLRYICNKRSRSLAIDFTGIYAINYAPCNEYLYSTHVAITSNKYALAYFIDNIFKTKQNKCTINVATKATKGQAQKIYLHLAVFNPTIESDAIRFEIANAIDIFNIIETLTIIIKVKDIQITCGSLTIRPGCIWPECMCIIAGRYTKHTTHLRNYELFGRLRGKGISYTDYLNQRKQWRENLVSASATRQINLISSISALSKTP